MSTPSQIDYDALASQHGGKLSIDYDSLAQQHGGTAAAGAGAPPTSTSHAGFFSGLGSETLGAVKGLAQPFAPPESTGERILDVLPGALPLTRMAGSYMREVQRNKELAEKAGTEGHPGTAIMRATAAGLPLVGPLVGRAMDIGQQIQQGEVTPGEGVGRGTSLALQAMSMAPEGSPIPNPVGIAGRVGARVASIRAPKTPPTAPTEALASFVDTRGGAVEPHAIAAEIQPLLVKQAAVDGLNLSKLKGRTAGKAAIDTTNNAINTNEQAVNRITSPHGNVEVGQNPIAEAYLKRRTPELIRNDPEAAGRLLTEARKYADVNNSGEIIGTKTAKISEINDFRRRMNNETSSLQSKGEGAFRKSDWESKADVDAVAAARDVQYGSLARLSTQGQAPEAAAAAEANIRQLQRNEGQLMEFRDSLRNQFNQASSEHAEAVAQSIRANPPGSGRFAMAIRAKTAMAYPSHRGIIHRVAAELGPKPLEVFNSRLQLAFSGGGTSSGGTITPSTSTTTILAPQSPGESPAASTSTSTTAAAASALSPGTPSTVQLGPGAPGLMGVTRSLTRGGASVGKINYSVAGDTLTINDIGGPTGNYNALSNTLGREGVGQVLDKIRQDHPEVKYVQGIRVGGARGEAGLSVRFPIDRLPRSITPQDAAYTQARAELGANAPPSQVAARARVLTPPAPPAAATAVATPRPSRAIAGGHMTVSDVMSRLKSGDITQAQADQLIQRIRGGGSGKTLRIPQRP